MSAYSTIRVSRDKAIAYLIRRIVSASDSQLVDMLDAGLDDRLYTSCIDDSGADDDLLDLRP